MKGYVRSYILGSMLIAGAFIVLFMSRREPFPYSKAGSWALFIGGALLVTVGWQEQNKPGRDKKK